LLCVPGIRKLCVQHDRWSSKSGSLRCFSNAAVPTAIHLPAGPMMGSISSCESSCEARERLVVLDRSVRSELGSSNGGRSNTWRQNIRLFAGYDHCRGTWPHAIHPSSSASLRFRRRCPTLSGALNCMRAIRMIESSCQSGIAACCWMARFHGVQARQGAVTVPAEVIKIRRGQSRSSIGFSRCGKMELSLRIWAAGKANPSFFGSYWQSRDDQAATRQTSGKFSLIDPRP